MTTRIMVINNSDNIFAMFRKILEIDDCEVFLQLFLNADLRDVRRIKPDLIILDYYVGREGVGWEFLQLLKMEDSTANIPIIVNTTPFRLSAEIQDYLFTRYIKVVPKPFAVETFLNLVHKTLMEARQSNMIFSGDRTLPILLVDDDEELRDNFVTVLRMENYRVITARNGQLALDTISEADFCLILLDIDMPVMNGYQFLDAYAQQLQPHSPVIITSANRDVLSHILPAFVVDILTKPFHLDQLLKVVGKYAEPVEG